MARLALASLLLLAISPVFSQPNAGPSQWRWSGIERVVAVGDIHGAYPALIELLKTSGIVDQNLHWNAGTTHFVSLGDLLDRGPQSRQVMDLLMRLHREALAAGGRVHVVAGNHEIMNLMGDLRYVSKAEFAAYSDFETAQMRDLAYQDFVFHKDGISPSSTLGRRLNGTRNYDEHRRFFEDRFAPGFFGHRRAFAPEGTYGRWLLSLPAMIIINDTVYAHGGLPAIATSASLEQLNIRYRSELQHYLRLWHKLIDDGVLFRNTTRVTRSHALTALKIADPASCPDKERAQCEQQRSRANKQQTQLSAAALSELRQLVRLDNSPLLGPDGPLWYRGSVRCKRIFEQPVLQGALRNLKARRLVVGHTPTYDSYVHELRNGQVIMLDTGMLASHYKGRPAALLLRGDNLQVQYLQPRETAKPKRFEPDASYPLTSEQLLEALRLAPVISVAKRWFGKPWDIELLFEGITIKALFYPDNRQPLAAYALDGLLGFEIVPPAIERVIEGRSGALQLSFPGYLTELERSRRKTDYRGRCAIEPQLQLVEIFDLLSGGSHRSRESIRYMMPSWTIYVSTDGKLFNTDTAIGDFDKYTAASIPAAATNALRAIDSVGLARATGSWLDDQQRAAVLARRDALLRRSGSSAVTE